MTETMTLVSEGERTVIGIELPKGKPQSPTRKVSFDLQGNEKYSPAGWIYATELGDIKIGDLVSYRIEKNADGFNKLTHIAPVASGSEPRDHMAVTSSGHDDAPGGDERGSVPVPAERDVPNTDTARFESWAFVANVGMVDLAYEELTDALEAGELDEISPALLMDVARYLLNAADQAQRSLIGRTVRGAQSHVRAREVVRTALRKHPVRVGLHRRAGASDDLDGWADDLAKTTARLLRMAAAL